MKMPFSPGNRVRILLHIAAWAILLGLPLYIINRWDIDRDFVWFYYANITISGIIFYGNYLVLIPRLFFERLRYRYYISAVLLMICLFFINDFSTEKFLKSVNREDSVNRESRGPDNNREGRNRPGDDRDFRRPAFRILHIINFSISNMFITFFALGLRVLERNAQIEKRQKELEKEKLNSELAFLKNQVSPHFFFNTLNNIYALISINAEDSQNAVLKLSRLMRYLLYESEQGQTQLLSEIDFMKNYIDLMRLRMSTKVKLTVDFPEAYENIAIPPLLFIPFIENAFKHGISYRENSFIAIGMQVTAKSLTFTCSNSNFKTSDPGSHSGIGLENVSKRLNLLFPGRHDLSIKRTDAAFDVELNILL